MRLRVNDEDDRKALWEEIQRLKQEYERLEREFKQYRKRHPETVGVKHGKAYAIKPSPKPRPAADPPAEKRRPGGQPGHKGHHRKQPALATSRPPRRLLHQKQSGQKVAPDAPRSDRYTGFPKSPGPWQKRLNKSRV